MTVHVYEYKYRLWEEGRVLVGGPSRIAIDLMTYGDLYADEYALHLAMTERRPMLAADIGL